MAPPQTTRFQPALRFLVISTMVIVGAITGLMLTLSWPNTLAMQTARKTQCLNNLREVVNALQTYAAAKDHLIARTPTQTLVIFGAFGDFPRKMRGQNEIFDDFSAKTRAHRARATAAESQPWPVQNCRKALPLSRSI